MRKKLCSVLLACLLWICGTPLLAACNKEVKLSSISLKPGTLQTTIIKDGDFTTSNIVVVAKYNNGTTKEVAAADLEITPKTIDTSVVGSHEITIRYQTKAIKETVNVVEYESELYVVTSMQSNLWNEYQTNRSLKAVDDKRTEFYDREQPLYAGMDNEFNLRISATYIGDNGDLISGLTDVRTKVTVFEKRAAENDGEQYVQLTPAEVDELMEITKTNAIKFKDAAEGKYLRLKFEAESYNNIYSDNAPSTTADVFVTRGFNVYSASDLAMYDNTGKYYVNQQAAIREKYGLEPTYSPTAMFLQSAIVLTPKDIDQAHIWQANDEVVQQVKSKWGVDATNTPKDYWGTGLYHRNIEDGASFDFVGNYFEIDLKQMPQCVIMWEPTTASKDFNINLEANICTSNNPITTHVAVFFTRSHNTTTSSSQNYLVSQEGTCVNWKNLYFTGNGPMNAEYKYSGGQILMKNWGVNFNGYNNITHNCYVAYFFEQGDKRLTGDWDGLYENAHYNKQLAELDGQYTIDHCKVYSSFQNLLYCNSPEHIIIKDCDIQDAGGPAIIVDHDLPKNDTYHGQTAPCVDIINSTVISYVNAASPWFRIYKADELVSTLISSGDSLFDNSRTTLPQDSDKTIKTRVNSTVLGGEVEVVNIMALIKGNGEMDSQGNRTYGYIRKFKDQTEYDNYYKTAEFVREYYGLDLFAEHYNNGQDEDHNFSAIAMKNNDIIFQSSEGGYIDQNVATTHLISTYPGVVKANYLDGILTQGGATSTLTYANCGFNLDPMIADLKSRLDMVALKETQQSGTIDTLYNQGMKLGQVFTTVEGWASLDAAAKISALKAQVEAYKTAYTPYYSGNYLNVYIFNGMNAMLELYTRH